MEQLNKLLNWLSFQINLCLKCMHSSDLEGNESLRANYSKEISTLREVYDHVVRMTIELEKEVI